MAALLVALSVMSIMLATALPVWRTMVQREREAGSCSGASSMCRRSNCSRAEPADSRHRSTCSATVVSFENSTKIRSPMATSSLCIWARLAWVACLRAWPAAAAAAGTRSRIVRGAGPAAEFAGDGRLTADGRDFTVAIADRARIGSCESVRPGVRPRRVPARSSASRAGAPRSLRLYNGRNHYNEWLFVSTAATRDAGAGRGARRRAWAFPAVEVAEAAARSRWRLVVAGHRTGWTQSGRSDSRVPRRLRPDAPTPLAGRTHRRRRR